MNKNKLLAYFFRRDKNGDIEMLKYELQIKKVFDMLTKENEQK